MACGVCVVCTLKTGSALYTALSRIGFFSKPEARDMMAALLNELTSRHGTKVVLFAQRRQDGAYYRSRIVAAETLEIIDQLHKAHVSSSADPDAVVARARLWEDRLGITINEMTVSHRHFGRGYALGGFHHPRSRMSETVSYAQMLAAYVGLLDALDKAIQEHRLTMILGGPREAALMARFHRIPFRTLAASRYRNYHYWACDEFWQTDSFATKYSDPALQLEFRMDAPIYGYMVNRGRFFDRVTLRGAVKQVALRTARQIYWTLRDYEKRHNYYYLQDVAYHIRLPLAWRALKQVSRTRLADLDSVPYVYMPLQTEPEMALQGLSPRNTAQLATLAAVARDLPAGVVLAVKETLWGVGRRPDDFYGQIADFKNVVLLDPMEPGQACVARAKAVALITGSSGFEATAMGVPVLSFGAHNIYNFAPHVSQVSLDQDLRQPLLEAIAPSKSPAERQQDGIRFLNAVIAASFDLGSFDFVRQDSFSREVINAAIANMIDSLMSMPNNVETTG